MMSKKDYEMLSNVFNRFYNSSWATIESQGILTLVIEELSDELGAINKNFNKYKFTEECKHDKYSKEKKKEFRTAIRAPNNIDPPIDNSLLIPTTLTFDNRLFTAANPDYEYNRNPIGENVSLLQNQVSSPSGSLPMRRTRS